jgi:hypothetical protein
MSAYGIGETTKGDATASRTVGQLPLNPSLSGLERGVLIRGMDGTLYWVSEKMLKTSVKDGGCLLPITDQPLEPGDEVTDDNRVRKILQERLDVLPSVVNVRNAIRGYLRVPMPNDVVPSGPTQPRNGRVADEALNRLVVYIERATGADTPQEP